MQSKKILKQLVLITGLLSIISACSSSYKRTKSEMGINQASSFEEAKKSLFKQENQNNNIVYFDLNKYCIRPEFYHLLDKQAVFLIKNPFQKVIIEGHADERGTPEYNIALGERRANSLRVYLQSKGVSAQQITIISYGKEKPITFGHDELSYSKNRRAILVY
ncbi:peptidoglycan-associated lipoprotein Pal [Sodalis sp. CWE]|uniref:peptidoglycan-associated lipoprotein Pal n=1 Tax=Sodalis sp. CWE TaxID=2803816 RepID=UPI001C7CCDAC|nr:peptidoglycan-associated lipoprotein Pal [Sodalis sp. CWE]MBX4180941.1 peptidoglycan-associated lipoprotein Pal [Sodalis sp. CWE]